MARRRKNKSGRRRRAERRRGQSAGRAAIEAAPGVAGSGAALGGTAALGPAGALLGPAASTAVARFFKLTGLDCAFTSIAEQFAAREQARAKMAFETAMKQIGERLDAGDGLRDDGFFDWSDEEREPSDAERILEGVVRAACETHEERKAERLGELYAFLAFNSDITTAHASYLVELTKRLTYQQLLLLGFFGSEGQLPDWSPTGMFTRHETGLVMAVLDLSGEGLVVRKDHKAIASFADINLAQMRTVLNGTILVEAMDLERAEPEDIEAIADALRRLGTMDADEGRVRAEAVVPPGSPKGTKRVKMDKRVVRFDHPAILLDDLPPAD